MNHERVLFDVSSGFVVLCVIAGLGYAYLLYSARHPWSVSLNRFLFVVRAALAFVLAFLLMGPILRQVQSLVDQPVFVLLVDNSSSVKEATNQPTREALADELQAHSKLLKDKGFEVPMIDLAGSELDTLTFEGSSSDISSALRHVSNQYEGRKVSGVLLVSDGIYNSGLSPVYSSFNFPVHTLGIGDTTVRKDIAIKNVLYNKIAYQGNQFPIRVEVLPSGFADEDLSITLTHNGVPIDKQIRRISGDQLVVFDFQTTAETQGILKYDIQVEVKKDEANPSNNRASVFVEVVEGKKRIVIVAANPHPDIKAIRSVIEKNENYETEVIIPGLAPVSAALEKDPDLVIFHQVPDVVNRTRPLLDKYLAAQSSLLFIVGRRTDVVALGRLPSLIRVESLSRDVDEVTPVLNQNFDRFNLDEEVAGSLAQYPPVSVPFGKISVLPDATPLLYQRVGSISTTKPLLAVNETEQRKSAVLLGEGIWRWRLDEFERTESARSFDEIISKLIQYLCTVDDKKRFRSAPVKQEFSEFEPVIFESQVYNDIYEPIFGNEVEIVIVDARKKRSNYQYVLAPGNARYQIGGLAEGVYSYTASTELSGKRETVQGQFAVVKKLLESQNLTADFELLRRLSSSTGGDFYSLNQREARESYLEDLEATGRIHTEESYNSMINLKWIFFVLLTMVTVEWFVRKLFAGY